MRIYLTKKNVKIRFTWRKVEELGLKFKEKVDQIWAFREAISVQRLTRKE